MTTDAKLHSILVQSENFAKTYLKAVRYVFSDHSQLPLYRSNAVYNAKEQLNDYGLVYYPDMKVKQFFNSQKMFPQESPRSQSDLDTQISDRYFNEIVSFEKECC